MDYSKMTVKELKKICKERKLKKYSKLKKKELVSLLNEKRETGPAKMRPTSPLLKRIQKLI